MHERSPKETAIDVILYERDLLRHCANTVDAKREQAQQSPLSENKAEYYLAIEGFLLHLRNLIGFFINKRMEPTDLTLDRSQQWGCSFSGDSTRGANRRTSRCVHSSQFPPNSCSCSVIARLRLGTSPHLP
jgi:hypothetical protein